MSSKIIVASLCLSVSVFIMQFEIVAEGADANKAQKMDKAALKAEAISIVKRFGGALKPKLKGAIQKGGPVEAIQVCYKEAPAIARQLSKETGWNVSRVSLKARNSKSAIPDPWETKVLKQFDERQAKGESAEKMAYAEKVDGKFRFMKAQGVESLCLTCHGENIEPRTGRALNLFYRHDKAQGYSLGQIRGAFSLSKDL